MAVSQYFGLLGMQVRNPQNAQQRDGKAWKLLARFPFISLQFSSNCNKSDELGQIWSRRQQTSKAEYWLQAHCPAQTVSPPRQGLSRHRA